MNREIISEKRWEAKSQMEMPEIKNTVSEIKNSFNKLNSRIDSANENNQ